MADEPEFPAPAGAFGVATGGLLGEPAIPHPNPNVFEIQAIWENDAFLQVDELRGQFQNIRI